MANAPQPYKSRPVAIEAMQVNSLDDFLAAGAWCHGTVSGGINIGTTISVPTLFGDRTAKPGDYIIKNRAGNFEVMRAADFTSTYKKDN